MINDQKQVEHSVVSKVNVRQEHQERTEKKVVARKEVQARYRKKHYANNPWARAWKNAWNRCKYKKNRSYPSYGGRGIKLNIEIVDLKEIWIRDKADLMKQPSLDRIDPDGHYTKENCRFIELLDNIRHGSCSNCRTLNRKLKTAEKMAEALKEVNRHGFAPTERVFKLTQQALREWNNE